MKPLTINTPLFSLPSLLPSLPDEALGGYRKANRIWSPPFPASRREVSIDFDLGNLPPDIRRQVAQNVTNPATRKTYESIQMQLEITISRDRADIVLVCGKVVNAMGGMTREGFPLGSAEPILFP